MKTPLPAALDLHSRHCVLGSMDHNSRMQSRRRFSTTARGFREHVEALREKKRPVHLTMEAEALDPLG